MVTGLVSDLVKVRPVFFARTMLFAPTDSLEAGDIIKAGMQLRKTANNPWNVTSKLIFHMRWCAIRIVE